MTRLAHALIGLLEAYGVDTIFGIPGVHTAELYRGLAGSGIRHITPRHEQGAGFMADGYARVTGKPGVCLVITGPGLSNIATAMLQARGDSIPMLVISGVNDPGREGEGLLHEMPDQHAFAAQCAVFSRTVGAPDDLEDALAAAFDLFASARPGPVHIQIPVSLMSAPVQNSLRSRPAAVPPRPAPEAIEAAAGMLAHARDPLIIVGGGARHAADHAIRLAEALSCPLVATIHARQGFAPDHPLVVPASLSFDSVRRAAETSDLVLACGTEFGPTDYDVYASGYRLKPATLIRIDIDQSQLGRGPAAAIALQGDARTVLTLLAAQLVQRRQGEGGARAAAMRRDARAELSPDYERHVRLLEGLRDLAPEAIFVGDSTQLIYAGNMYFAPGGNGGWFNSSSGFGTLGYALPAAIGAKLGRPGQTVVALIGDGGAQFTLGEFGTLRDTGLKVIVIVWNNCGFGEIRSFMRARQIVPEGVDPIPPDFAMMARAYGLEGVRIDGEDALLPAFAAALKADGPVVIDLRAVN